jgi:hypothetical protein
VLRDLTEDSWTTKAEAAVGFSPVKHVATIKRTESRSDHGVNGILWRGRAIILWYHNGATKIIHRRKES